MYHEHQVIGMLQCKGLTRTQLASYGHGLILTIFNHVAYLTFKSIFHQALNLL